MLVTKEKELVSRKGRLSYKKINEVVRLENEVIIFGIVFQNVH
jgi:hypothetical protein